MKKALPIFYYIFGVLVGGALLSYPFYLVAQEIPFLADYKFGRVSNRAFMLLAILGLIPFFKKLKGLNLKKSGLVWDKKIWLRHFTLGYIFGLGTMLVMGAVMAVTDLRPWKEVIEVSVLVKALFKGFLTGIVVSLIEEPLFRGMIYQSVRKNFSVVNTILLISIPFAAVHFFKSKSGLITEVHWYSGFTHLSNAFHLWKSHQIIGSFLTLVAVGIFMHLCVLKNGNLIAAIGIHTGWVNAIKIIKKATANPPSKQEMHWLLGSYDSVTGYMAFFWIIILMVIYFFVNKKKILEGAKCSDSSPS